MGISGNYITMQRQIADECSDNQSLLAPLSDETGLLSPIQNAIQSAIAKWERTPFYFNQLRLQPLTGGPFNTVAAKEFYTAADYAALATNPYIKTVMILISSNRYELNPRDSSYLDNISVNPTNTGQPVDYCYEAQQLRLYPIPDNAYPLGIVGAQRFPLLMADNDTNPWTQDAYDLIKAEAKLILGRDVLFDKDLEVSSSKAIYGDPANPREVGYLKALQSETVRRNSGKTRIRPSYF